MDALQPLSRAFGLLASPARLRILLTIGRGEMCVCMLQARLGWRRAYISQQLMFLRQGGLLSSRRQGRFIFYRLRDPAWLQVIQDAAQLLGLSLPASEPGVPESCAVPSTPSRALQSQGQPEEVP